jgi:hypothetical protein
MEGEQAEMEEVEVEARVLKGCHRTSDRVVGRAL